MGDRTPYVIPQTVNATDGDVLTFDAASGTWVGAAGGGAPGSAWTTTTAIPASVASPELSQAPATSDVVPQNIVIQSQDAFAGATGANQVGGKLNLRSGLGTGSPVADGDIQFFIGSTTPTPSLRIDGTSGIVFVQDALATPEVIVTSALSTTITSGTSIPVTAADTGSLFLHNSPYNGLWTWNGAAYVPVPQCDANGTIQIDPSFAKAGIYQAQAASGAGKAFYLRSQAAATGSTASGGDVSFILGADDPGSANPSNPKVFWFGLETAVGGQQPSTNYSGIAVLKMLPGEVATLTMGGGTNGSGSNIAGVEISSFTLMSIATENSAPIHLNVNGGSTAASDFYVQQTQTDTTNEVAFKATYEAKHATSGDVSGLQINATITAMGTGVTRYFDVKDGGTRILDIRPDGAGFASIVFDQVKTAHAGFIRVGAIADNAYSIIAARDHNNTVDLNVIGANGGGTMQFADFGQFTQIQGLQVTIACDVNLSHYMRINDTGDLLLTGFNKGTTVGATGGASALPALPAGYLYPTVDGVVVAIPYYTHP